MQSILFPKGIGNSHFVYYLVSLSSPERNLIAIFRVGSLKRQRPRLIGST